jgi:hypothetical protein
LGSSRRRGSALHIIVVNEPRSYRETIGAVLRHERPGDVVTVDDPGDVEVSKNALVLCSSVTVSIRSAAAAWIDLYPGGGGVCTSWFAGSLETYASLDLAALLELITRLSGLAQLEYEDFLPNEYGS